MFYDKNFSNYTYNSLKKIIYQKEVVIFGASTILEKVIDKDIDKKKIKYICDNNSEKWNEKFLGISVYQPEKLLKESNDIVVITMVRKNVIRSIVSQLSELKIDNYFIYIEDEEKVEKYINTFVKDKKFLANNNLIEIEHKRFKYVHIFQDEKFIESFIKTLRDGFEIEEHLIIIYCLNISNLEDRYNIWSLYFKYINIYIVDDEYNFNNINFDVKLMKLKSIFDRSQKIIFHSLALSDVIARFFANNIELLEKSTWIFWGGEIFWDINSNDIRIYVARKIKYLITATKEEFDIVVDKFKLHNFEWNDISVKYNYISVNEINKIKMCHKKKDENSINIQIGHSGYDSGNHFEALNVLEKFKNENINIYCPIAYGDENYKRKLKEYGKKNFGDKFKYSTKFLSLEEYCKFLSDIDVLILPSDVQQGANNILLSLYLGNKIYLKHGKILYDIFTEYGYKIYNFENIKNESFDEFINDISKAENFETVSKAFSLVTIVSNWKKVFEI